MIEPLVVAVAQISRQPRNDVKLHPPLASTNE